MTAVIDKKEPARGMFAWADAMAALMLPVHRPYRAIAELMPNTGIRTGRTSRRGQPGNKLAKKAAKGRIGIVTRGY